DIDRLIAMVQAQEYYVGGNRGEYDPSGAPSHSNLVHAYTLLGIKENATDAEVKTAYRKLMSQHHPDKLVSRGLPEEMMKLATEKTQEIKAAYEAIVAARKT
ncbi:MAG: DnaJ domain-containing protein, partial [Gammaproteobacteria bacterium]|nr:DnaJ domain-containing protein [Gammaproteobacteria bacterium]